MLWPDEPSALAPFVTRQTFSSSTTSSRGNSVSPARTRRTASITSSITVDLCTTPAAPTSTASLTGGGVKKCVPQTLSGLLVAEARSVMEMEEVLVRKRMSGDRIPSSVANASFFGSTFSTIASMAASAPAMSSGFTSSGCGWSVSPLPPLRTRLADEARETVADVALDPFDVLDIGVVSDDFVPGLGGELDDAGAYRADAEDADSIDAVRAH